MSLRLLALDAYHGGSHRALLRGWQQRSRHAFTVLTLPGRRWKWRMRHAAITFADALRERVAAGERWDALWCTDMLSLAECVGLSPAPVQRLPRIAYFHENQLTFPPRPGEAHDPRDLHFAFTNLTTCLAADEVWWNSAYNRDAFLEALAALLARMPDHAPRDAVARVRARSRVAPPGIDAPRRHGPRPPGPLRILWPHRWEHDKGPALLFAALAGLAARGVDFRVSVVGQRFREAPVEFARARLELGDRIDRWGHLPRVDYEAALLDADVVLSTARHEFFGIAVLEAVAAGCLPLVPRALAYPETLGDDPRWFHDGTAVGIADRLTALADARARGPLAAGPEREAIAAAHAWPARARAMDDAVAALLASPAPLGQV